MYVIEEDLSQQYRMFLSRSLWFKKLFSSKKKLIPLLKWILESLYTESF